jgi:hypothetical protein
LHPQFSQERSDKMKAEILEENRARWKEDEDDARMDEDEAPPGSTFAHIECAYCPNAVDEGMHCSKCNTTFDMNDCVLRSKVLLREMEEGDELENTPPPTYDSDGNFFEVDDEEEEQEEESEQPKQIRGGGYWNDFMEDEEEEEEEQEGEKEEKQPLPIRGGGRSSRSGRKPSEEPPPSTPPRTTSHSTPKKRSSSKRSNTNIEKTPPKPLRRANKDHDPTKTATDKEAEDRAKKSRPILHDHEMQFSDSNDNQSLLEGFSDLSAVHDSSDEASALSATDSSIARPYTPPHKRTQQVRRVPGARAAGRTGA